MVSGTRAVSDSMLKTRTVTNGYEQEEREENTKIEKGEGFGINNLKNWRHISKDINSALSSGYRPHWYNKKI